MTDTTQRLQRAHDLLKTSLEQKLMTTPRMKSNAAFQLEALCWCLGHRPCFIHQSGADFGVALDTIDEMLSLIAQGN